MGYLFFVVLLAVVGWAVASLVRERRQRRTVYEEGVTQHREALRREREDSGEEEEWRTVIRHDPHVRQAFEIVSPLGEGAVEELRTAYRHIEDRATLPDIARRIAADRQP